jgi:predicted nucleic acid-binding protein
VIVVDTSVWVDHFNGAPTDEARLLADLVATDADVGIVSLCLTEILKGFRHDDEVDLVSGVLLAFPVLSFGALDDCFRAVELYRTARRKGRTVRSTIDCLIASVCIREDAILLHRDRDFDELAQCTPLRVLAT